MPHGEVGEDRHAEGAEHVEEHVVEGPRGVGGGARVEEIAQDEADRAIERPSVATLHEEPVELVRWLAKVFEQDDLAAGIELIAGAAKRGQDAQVAPAQGALGTPGDERPPGETHRLPREHRADRETALLVVVAVERVKHRPVDRGAPPRGQAVEEGGGVGKTDEGHRRERGPAKLWHESRQAIATARGPDRVEIPGEGVVKVAEPLVVAAGQVAALGARVGEFHEVEAPGAHQGNAPVEPIRVGDPRGRHDSDARTGSQHGRAYIPIVLWLLGCYTPPPYIHPAPAEVTMSDILSGVEPLEAATEADATAPAEAEAAIDAPGEAQPSAFDDAQVDPYKAFTVKTPLSIVDDAGQPVAVLGKPGVEVTVLSEASLRVKVRCDGCDPVVTGYLQRDAVQR